MVFIASLQYELGLTYLHITTDIIIIATANQSAFQCTVHSPAAENTVKKLRDML